MLSLDVQNEYRALYRRLHAGWCPSGEVYESMIRDVLRSNSKILDLGCGRGGIAEKLVVEGRTVFGLDKDRESLIGHRAPVVRFALSVAELQPFACKTFDVVLAAWLFEHLAQPNVVLAEIRRVLQPGGHCIFLTPNLRNPGLLVGRVCQAFPDLQRRLVSLLYGRDEVDIFRVFYRANSALRLRRLVQFNGLSLRRLEVVPDPTYLAFNDMAFRLAMVVERMLPPSSGVHLVGLLQRL